MTCRIRDNLRDAGGSAPVPMSLVAVALLDIFTYVRKQILWLRTARSSLRVCSNGDASPGYAWLLPILVAIHLLTFLDLLQVLASVLSKSPFLCRLDADHHHDESRKEADQRRTGITC